jgi:hypothetical protein
MKRFPTGRDLAESGISEENSFTVSVVIQTILPRFILEAVFLRCGRNQSGYGSSPGIHSLIAYQRGSMGFMVTMSNDSGGGRGGRKNRFP